jgi:large subunit ribosomal protein L7/L12
MGPGVIRQNFGWPYDAVSYLLVLLIVGLIGMRQIHRRGQTVPEAWATGQAERRQRQAELRQRAARRERARRDAAALPWLNDDRLRPADEPGVLIAPAPDPPGYFVPGYDLVLDSAGNKKIQVIQQIRRLTRLSLKESKDLVDADPAAVLRVPDQPMACAAKSILESVGATVSIIDLASSQRSTDVQCGEPDR